ncbi:MAG: SMEK domain-containing protein [Pirellula sp.]
MPRNREAILNELKEWFVTLQSQIQADGALRHQKSLIEQEGFFCALLNASFGWRLANANMLSSGNQDSFDLVDNENSIVVQVTVTDTPAKTRKTIKSFVENHRDKFESLKFVYPIIEKTKSTAKYAEILNGFDFDVNRDRVDLGDILRQVQSMTEIEEQERVLNLVRRELEPIGKALRLGVDQTLETLIRVVEYMSTHAPTERITMDESSPDLRQKRARLREGAEQILKQWQLCQPLHATVRQAREAIGYDLARVAKIQTWLKIRSVEELNRTTGAPMLAFQSIVTQLLDVAHSAGTDAEETAVRFLLADEFVRCNLFPNP